VTLVCGDRRWKHGAAPIIEALRQYGATSVIHGAAKGADTCGDFAAKTLRLPVQSFPAEWDRHGKAAGPIRNQRMLTEGKPDLVLAFHDDIEGSKGTKDMVARATRAGVRCVVLSVPAEAYDG